MFAGEALAARVIRGEPAPGTAIEGPALCALPESTLLVPPGWRGDVDAHGTIQLAARAGGHERCSTRSSCSSLAGALRAACEEMGVVLIRSAHSSNIKERRDASTALFDTAGRW